jgi:hypothetical protein
VSDQISSPTGPGDEGENGQNDSNVRIRRRGALTRLGMRAGFYPGAPRRNALVAITYLLFGAVFARLLGLF